jgi:hypothetical protein
VTHACNPSYSGGRDQEDHGSKPAWANSSQDPVSKKPITKKRAGGVAQGGGPEFKPQYHEKKKKKEKGRRLEHQVQLCPLVTAKFSRTRRDSHQ